MIKTKHRLELIVDGVPYLVNVVPYEFNEGRRYSVNFNGGPDYIFTWDTEINRLKAIGDEAATMPDNLEKAIAEKLQSAKY